MPHPIPSILVFDVNETLLDLASLDPLFERHLGNASFRAEWFGQVLKSAFAYTVMGEYQNFGVVARTALAMVAKLHDVNLTDTAIEEILGQMSRLAPHPDVLTGIQRLQSAGYTMAALTNSPPKVAHAQLENAGIAPHLSKIMSVDASKSLKPHRSVYDDAANELGVSPENIMLIAAHSWGYRRRDDGRLARTFPAAPGKSVESAL